MDKTLGKNYRRIALLELANKVEAKILRNRLQRYEDIIREYQGDLRIGRSTTDQISTLKTLQNKVKKRFL